MTSSTMHSVEKGEKRCATAFQEHVNFCERAMKRSAFKYPWELGFLAEKDNTRFPFGPIGAAPLVPALFRPDDDELKSDQMSSTSVFDQHCRKLFCRLPKIEWDVHLDTQRNAGLAKWHKIVMKDPISFEVCRTFFNSVKAGLHTGRLQDDLKNVFAGKSTSTLHNRAGPMMRYIHFCEGAQFKPFPICEEVVYSFMQREEQSAAPTFLKSFMCSLGFSLYVMGLTSAKHVVDSKRVRGLADKMYLLERKTRSRLPLRVDELGALEEVVLGRKGRSIADRHAAAPD